MRADIAATAASVQRASLRSTRLSFLPERVYKLPAPCEKVMQQLL